MSSVHPFQIIVTQKRRRIHPLLPAVEPQDVELYPYRTARLAQTAHQAVVRHLVRQFPIPPVAQEIDRLYVVDTQVPLELARVEADAAP